MHTKTSLAMTLLVAVLAPMYVTGALADTLSINYERTALATTTYSTVATNAAGTYNFGNSVTHTDGYVYSNAGKNYGFYDDYIFSIGNGQVDSVASTIDLSGVYGITNFEVRLFTVADASTPGTLGSVPAVGGTLLNAWTTSINCGTGCTGTINVIAPYNLSAGSYDLQIRGTAEAGGGSYSGVLNVLPVPVPAAFPLLFSGIGMLSGMLRRRA